MYCKSLMVKEYTFLKSFEEKMEGEDSISYTEVISVPRCMQMMLMVYLRFQSCIS